MEKALTLNFHGIHWRGHELSRSYTSFILKIGLLCAGAALAGCGGQAPRGQVVATVGGQEITVQDLAAEARAGGRGEAQTQQSLLQAVIAQVLLAQEAHAKGLDQYPGYPSDVARLQRQMLDQKLLQSVVKPPARPSQADIAKFKLAHPLSFAQREKLKVDEIQFQASGDMTELNGASTIPAVVDRLKSLNAPVQEQRVTLDTATIPGELAARVANEPVGQLFYIRGPHTSVGMVIDARESVQLPDDESDALAINMMNQISTGKQVNDEIASLKNKAHIAYQSGYGPGPATPAAAKPKAPSGG